MRTGKIPLWFCACAVAAGLMAGCGRSEGKMPADKVSGSSIEAEAEHFAQAGEHILSGEPIRIGAIYALSGNNAAIGTNILRGIDFAVEEINASGGIHGRPIEIVRGDTQGDPQIARTVAEKLIQEDHVQAILGCHQSTSTEIVFQTCEEYQIPMITAISTVDSISAHNYEYCFRLCPMNSLYLEDMFMYLRDQEKETGDHVKTIAVFADDSMIGQEAIRCAQIYAPQYDMEIVEEVQYRQGAADLTKEIQTLKAADADAVLAESYVSDAILLVKTMQEQDYRPSILIAKANGFADPSFIPAAGAAGERADLRGRMESGSDERAGDQSAFQGDLRNRYERSFRGSVHGCLDAENSVRAGRNG
jgi:branched-chain amino acid transport system substrate-binding protein